MKTCVGRRKPLRTLCLVAGILLGGFAWAVVTKDVGNKENITASLLEGKWETDPDLCKKLGSKSRISALEFRYDPGAIPDKVLSRLPEEMGTIPVYAAGRVKMTEDGKTTEWPFFLTVRDGNPHLVVYREREGDPYGDAESANVMGIRAKDSARDLLFLGADFNNEPMRAFRRKTDTPPAPEK